MTANSAGTAGLKRALRLRDLILLNIVAVYTPSTLAQNMPLGRIGLLVWALAILTFLLPYGAAISDLSVKYPKEGGVYAWTRLALGDFHGFVCGWCYWVNTFLYVPSVFLGIAAVSALLFNGPAEWMSGHKFETVMIAIITLWLSAGLHIVGLGQGKWLQNIGAFGRMAIALALIAAAVWKIVSPEASVVSPSAAQPDLDMWRRIALWPFTLNALVGLDLGSAMSEETDSPGRNIPRSLIIGGSAVAACYMLTYLAVLITGFNETNVIYGHVLAINSVFSRTGEGALITIGTLVVLSELLGLLGCGASWLSAPARVPFAIGIDHYLPKAFARVHPKYGTPYVALLVQAAVATALILINVYGATLQEAYLALLGGSIVLVMITYIYLFIAWVRLSKIGDRINGRILFLCTAGLAATIFATLACFIPPPIVAGTMGFEFKIIGSVSILLAFGLILYAIGNILSKRAKLID
ncbi:MAG: APC family permease [Acidobacteria bacterium]|nr:APC family permease [Acidobacteriota bacterium]